MLTFLIVLGLFGAKFLTDNTTLAVENNNLGGIEAFVLNNLLLVFFIALLIFIVAYTYIGGGNQ